MYCSVEDVVLISGYAPSDFRYMGEPMTLSQFRDMVESLIEDITVQINRYCNVDTFEIHQIKEEYHTLSGYDAADYRMGFYSPARTGTQFFTESYSDVVRTLFPREQPVISVDLVEVNHNVNYAQGPKWEAVYEYGNEAGEKESYMVLSKLECTSVYFIRNFPNFAKNNVRITYTAGYPKGHEIWAALRSACRIAVMNILNYKQRQQQIMTLRGTGVMDYASLFDGDKSEYSYLSKDVKDIIDKYRVPALPIDMWD